MYKIQIDGLEKNCIATIASEPGNPITCQNKKPLATIKKLDSELECPSSFASAMDLVSNQRGLASRNVRFSATPFNASSPFTKNLSLCVKFLKELLERLESSCGITGKSAQERHHARKRIIKIVPPQEDHYSIKPPYQMEGKTVEIGEAELRSNDGYSANSAALMIDFTDRSMMSLDTGSNISELIRATLN